MQPMAQTFPVVEPAHPVLHTITTTLYELIKAIGEEMQPGEDWLVAETVFHLFATGKVKFSNVGFDINTNYGKLSGVFFGCIGQ